MAENEYKEDALRMSRLLGSRADERIKEALSIRRRLRAAKTVPEIHMAKAVADTMGLAANTVRAYFARAQKNPKEFPDA